MGTKAPRLRTLPPFPWIVAHRGSHRQAPENTLPAFDIALAENADGIEFDVQLSRDGIPMVWHDRTLARAAGVRKRASDLTAAQLGKLKADRRAVGRYGRARLVPLQDVLERYRGKTRFLVEIKSREHDRRTGRHLLLAERVVETLAAAKVRPKDIYVLSFDREVLAAARSIRPGWRYVLNLEDPSLLPTPEELERHPLFACCLPVRRLTAGVCRRLHRHGLLAMTYACNRPCQVRRALTAGADVIMSDVPGEARLFLQREKLP